MSTRVGARMPKVALQQQPRLSTQPISAKTSRTLSTRGSSSQLASPSQSSEHEVMPISRGTAQNEQPLPVNLVAELAAHCSQSSNKCSLCDYNVNQATQDANQDTFGNNVWQMGYPFQQAQRLFVHISVGNRVRMIAAPLPRPSLWSTRKASP